MNKDMKNKRPNPNKPPKDMTIQSKINRLC
jgi:hypothetical protein